MKYFHIVADIIMACVRELKRQYQSISSQAFSFEQCIEPSFVHKLRAQLEPIWHKLGWKTKHLVRACYNMTNVGVTAVEEDVNVTKYAPSP